MDRAQAQTRNGHGLFNFECNRIINSYTQRPTKTIRVTQCPPPQKKLWAGIKILEKFTVGGGTESPGSLGGGDFGWEIQNSQISVGGGTRNLTKKKL